MAESSSISNSNSHANRPAIPWAFLLAIGIFALVEIYLHTRDPHTLIAYPQLAAADDQTVTYKAVREYVTVDGPADIALVGSSQMREGVSMPFLIDQLKSHGVNNPIANYAVRGARVDVMESISVLLTRQEKLPKIVVIGLSARDLRGDSPAYSQMAIFWDFPQLGHELRSGDFAHKVSVTPIVVRNEVGTVINTLRYRDQLQMTLAQPLARFGIDSINDSNPILGQQSFQLQGNRGLKRLDEALKGKVSLRKILNNARLNNYWPAKDNHYTIETRPIILDRLKMMISRLQSHGCQVLIVEMPVAKVWQAELERVKMADEFDRVLKSLSAQTGVRFVPVKDQPIDYTDDLFSDLQHHNRPGAEKFSAWLAGEIADILKVSPTTKP